MQYLGSRFPHLGLVRTCLLYQTYGILFGPQLRKGTDTLPYFKEMAITSSGQLLIIIRDSYDCDSQRQSESFPKSGREWDSGGGCHSQFAVLVQEKRKTTNLNLGDEKNNMVRVEISLVMLHISCNSSYSCSVNSMFHLGHEIQFRALRAIWPIDITSQDIYCICNRKIMYG